MSIKRYDSDTKELNDVAGVYRLEGGGSTIEVDDELSTVSENPVQNKIITGELNKKLTEVSVMPQNPTDKQRVLFVGETAGEYVKGTIYEYSETQSKWNPISTAEIEVDDSLDSTSGNPVQNKVIVSALGAKQPIQLVSAITLESHAYDTVPTALSALATRLEDTYKKNEVNTELDDKVDKVTGKGLSTEDYTTEEKTKLGGIESGAEVNVQADWNTTTTTDDSYIKNKPDIYLKSETYNRTEVDAKVAGLLNPMGTVAFANLPTLATANVGDMYNVSDQFVTTSDFEEGAGEIIPAGSNVYKTTGGKWDVLAGSPVTGVKGDKESTYRKGNVNITPANIGAYTSGQVDTLLSGKQNLILSNPMMLESHSYNRTETALGALATRLEATYTKDETDEALSKKPNIFTGTTEEWEALTPAQKQVFYGGYANFTDDSPLTSSTLLASLARSSTEAGIKRMIYGGKNLETSVTSAQKTEIKNGTFRGMTVGDYWVIGGVHWVIVDFDYWLRCGDSDFTGHHLVVQPSSVLYYEKMNDTNTTEGGYVGSKMYKSGLDNAKSTIKNTFGESNILTHREYLVNAVTNGKPSNGAWYDSQIELPNEIMMYGHPHFTPACDGSTIPALYTIDKAQLALYQVRPDLISNRMHFWLRDVVSAAYFANVNADGFTFCANASRSLGVRPVFGVAGE